MRPDGGARLKLPSLIAEIGLNHGGSLARAVQMVRELGVVAREYPAGIAAKFQAVFPETLCTADSPTYFQQVGEIAPTQREFFTRSATFTQRDYEFLADECVANGVEFLCTPFDVATVGWLNPLVKAFKIASADITNIPLLDAIAATGKPVYLSTGAATLAEIDEATVGRWRRRDVTWMHCVLSYPTPLADAHLAPIARWAPYGPTGYSDHTLFSRDVLTTAWLLGASVIEKHYTFDKTLPGNDHYHSMDQLDLSLLCQHFRQLQLVIGEGDKRVLPIEEAARRYARRGLYAARAIPQGKTLEAEDIAILRPSARLGPERYRSLLGVGALQDYQAGDPL